MRARLLYQLFTSGTHNTVTGGKIGCEVETIFTDHNGSPLNDQAVTAFFDRAVGKHGCMVASTYRVHGREYVDSIRDRYGSIISKEIGACNIEVATVPLRRADVVDRVRSSLDDLCCVLGYPRYGGPILHSADSLLPLEPSPREMEFLALDGHEVTNMMAGTSSVQFTVDVSPEDAVVCLSNLATQLPLFLREYPQDASWKRYVLESKAGYRADRYGGPLVFTSLMDYCKHLAEHKVISGGRLAEEGEVRSVDLHQFIKSVWWYFRLKRYGETLCVEIRPQARGPDDAIPSQLDLALSAMGI